MKRIVLGGGCFWCVEAVFSNVRGVYSALCGYSGGDEKSANYKDVCSGNTSHIEVVEVEYNENIVTLNEILKIFFSIHDPTTPNRQGNDRGYQYNSAIFYYDDEDRNIIEKYLTTLQKEKASKIVTKVNKIEQFYKAEEYHQNYFKNNPYQGYCLAVVAPKVEKVRDDIELSRYLSS